MQVSRMQSSSTFLLSGLLMLIIAFTLTACNGDASSATPPPSSQVLITRAQQAIQKVKSYHFNLATQNPGDDNGQIMVNAGDGDVQVPDKLKGTAQAQVSGIAFQTQIVAIDDQEYYTDPITGQWRQTQDLLDPRALSDPQTGIAALLGHIQNPSKPVSATTGGNACWSISGQLDSQYLTGITGGGTASGKNVDTTVCIGKTDNRPYSIVLKGIAMQGDATATTRTFILSKFDETLNIVAPIK